MTAPAAATSRSTAWIFAGVVAVWGTTWHAIHYQLAATTPAFGVALRFVIAGSLVLAWSAARGIPLRMPRGAHVRLALQGLAMYALAYLCVYHAERYVPSGLVAVGYAASPLVTGVGAWWLWRAPLTPRFVAGGVAGVVGVALIFRPELDAAAGGDGVVGLGYTVAAVVMSAIGALVASRNARARLSFWPALGWGLLWGGAGSAAVWLVADRSWVWPTAASWWLSLVYLSVAGTVLAFAGFLTLQQRLGAGRAASIGVAVPVVALAVSAAFEGYRPGAWAFAGALLAIGGNVAMLRPSLPRVDENRRLPAATEHTAP